MRSVVPALAFSIILGGAGMFLWKEFRNPPADDGGGATRQEIERLRLKVRDVEERLLRWEGKQESLAGQVSDLEARAGKEPPPPVSREAIEEAVARWLEENPLERSPEEAAKDGKPASPGATPPEDDGPNEMDLPVLLWQILAPGASIDDREALWQKVREAGLLDQAIEELKRRVKESPENIDLQIRLGSAYLQKISTLSNPLEKGALALEADRTFDAALAGDGYNWEARFLKAVTLYNWPPFLGKRPEAQKQFEILEAQQDSIAQRPEFIQTHLYLSKLYEEGRDLDRALQTVRKGIALFPGDEDLARRLNDLEAKASSR